MTEFIFGSSAASNKTGYILEKMKICLEDGKKVILIVPEQQALYWDSLCARHLPKEHMFDIETVSFTRLADSVFRTFGGVAKHYITDAEKTMIMWNAMAAVTPELKYYNNPERNDRYVPILRSAVSELKLYGVSPSELLSVSEKIAEKGNEMLSNRLSDLSLIYSAYDTMLHERYDDPEEILDALYAALENRDFFSGKAVFIDSFHTLTPKQTKVAEHIFRQSEDVFITFSLDIGERDGEYTSYVRDHVKQMARLAAAAGRKVETRNCEGAKNEAISYLARNLWNYSAPLYDGGENVEVISCADRYDEATVCAAKIRELVRNGASFSDICVVAADFKTLQGITDVQLEAAGIPVYVSQRAELVSQPAMRLIQSVCNVVSRGWRREDVMACAASGLCGLSPDMCDALERYTEIWNIHGKRMFCREDKWSMNPAGYTQNMSEWSQRMLMLANEARDILIPPIEAFSESFPGKTKDICTSLFKLLCDFGVYESLRREVEDLVSEGQYEKAERKAGVWDAVCSVLDTLATAVPDATPDAAHFSALIGRAAEACSIGTIPDGIDRVVMGSAGSVRLGEVKHLIVLGAKSGEFPKTSVGDGFFSDLDKMALKDEGILLSPPSGEKIGQELFLFKHTVCMPSETLTVIIPADDDGSVHPSAGALRIMKLLKGAKIRDLAGSEGIEAIRRYNVKLRGMSFSSVPMYADNDSVCADEAEAIFGKSIDMTQSKIECFNDCAFKYWCKYILNLDEGNAAKLDPANVGNFIHKILEDFMRESAQTGFPVSDVELCERTERLTKEYISSVAPETAGARLDYLFRRLTRSVKLFARSLNNEFAQSEFVPYGFELRVGFDDSLPACPIELDGDRRMYFRGIVDRVDVYREGDSVYVRVADYKTGAKKFSLEECLQGRNVQLLLYLFSLCQSPEDCDFRKKLAPRGEKILPAGALYFSAVPGETSSPKALNGDDADNIALSNIQRSGIVSSKISIISAMDKNMEGVYAPVKLKADGSFNSNSSVADDNEFKDIQETMTAALRETGNRILKGEAGSVPKRDPCKYCPVSAICRHRG